jgi:hypothetical protein
MKTEEIYTPSTTFKIKVIRGDFVMNVLTFPLGFGILYGMMIWDEL